MAVVCYYNVATNDGQDGPFSAPTMIRRRYVATSHSPTLYYCQRQTAAAHRRRRLGGNVEPLLSAFSKTRRRVPVLSRAVFVFKCLSASRVYDCTSSVRNVRYCYNRTRWFCAVPTYEVRTYDVQIWYNCTRRWFGLTLSHSLLA
jgi:hypothetical protein